MPRVRIVKAGMQTSVQDEGRRGFEHLGVMVGGWVDDFAPRWANRLLGNATGAAVLEFTLLGPEIEALDAGWVALAGANMSAAANGVPWSPGSTCYLHAGDQLTFGSAAQGARAYLGFAGGIDVPAVFSSRSTDLLGRFGGFAGRVLKPGDELSYAGGTADFRRAPVETCLRGSKVRVLRGVGSEHFPPESWDRLLHGSYRMTDRSDRVGLRLEGPAIADTPMRGDHLSEGIAIGSIEVPPSGELLVLLKSRGSIGGYATLAHVAAVDWPTLGQLSPGDEVSFVEVDTVSAEALLREREALFNLEPLTAEPLEVGTRTTSPTELVEVRAPMWCIVHEAKLPGQPVLAKLGDRVTKGRPLAIFEVMGQFYDLSSPSDGRIVSVRFHDGAVVAKDTVLFVIDRARTWVDIEQGGGNGDTTR